MNILVIGIVGGTGSGKTSLSNKIRNFFKDDVSILSLDFYYKDNSHLSFKERLCINYDNPNAFDMNLLIKDVRKLKNDHIIYHPVYDYKEHNRKKELVRLEPTKILILEGILLFTNKELLDLIDIKIFIDTDDDIRILRRLVRDVKSRGRSIDSVISQYIKTTKPMHDKFVKPSKQYANIVIDNVLENDIIFDMLIHKIQAFLNK